MNVRASAGAAGLGFGAAIGGGTPGTASGALRAPQKGQKGACATTSGIVVLHDGHGTG